MGNIGYYIGVLGGLWLLVGALRKGSAIFRDWRHQGQVLLGAVAISLGGLGLFRPEAPRATRAARIYFMFEDF